MLRNAPFVAGIRGMIYNSWYDSAIARLGAAAKEIPRELASGMKGVREIVDKAFGVISKKGYFKQLKP